VGAGSVKREEGSEKNGRMKLEFGIQGVSGLEGKHPSPLNSVIILFFFFFSFGNLFKVGSSKLVQQ